MTGARSCPPSTPLEDPLRRIRVATDVAQRLVTSGSASETQVTGSCHCGNITYVAEVDATTVRICHCTDCQKLTGTVFRAGIPSLPGTFRLKSGTPKIYIKTAESGNKRAHAFCPECGTPIYSAVPEPNPVNLRTQSRRDRSACRVRATDAPNLVPICVIVVHGHQQRRTRRARVTKGVRLRVTFYRSRTALVRLVFWSLPPSLADVWSVNHTHRVAPRKPSHLILRDTPSVALVLS
jgi:hypothetical protein